MPCIASFLISHLIQEVTQVLEVADLSTGTLNRATVLVGTL